MDKEKLIPSLRFSGCNDVWEQRKFTDITYPAGEKNRDNLPLESYSITNESGFVPQNEKFENGGTMKDADKTMYYIVSPKSFAYNPARINVGSIGYQNLDRNVIVSSLYEVFKTREDIDDRFLWHWFKGNAFQKTIEQYQEGGVRLYFYYDKLCMCSLAMPSVEEQCKIGETLDAIDHLITLHQNEYDKLLIMKKTMLGKMFPKNGSQVPEVRFSEFDGAWEYRKLGAISDKITEKNGYMEFTETFTNSAEYGIINQRDFFNHDIAKQEKINGYYIVRPEDFVYNPRISTTAPVGPIGRNKLGRCGVISPLYTVFRSKEVDNSFLEQFFKSSHWYSFMRFNGDTGARSDRFSIKDTTFFEMPIPFPKVEEQRRIGQYLAGLDVLISLQEKKLTKLKNIKVGCLEKMFV